MKFIPSWLLLWLLPFGLYGEGNFPTFDETGASRGRSPRSSPPAGRKDEGFSKFHVPIRLPEKYSLIVPDGNIDGEARELLFETPVTAGSSIALPGNIVCSQIGTTEASRSSLALESGQIAQLRLRWSAALKVWWVDAFVAIRQKTPPRDQLLTVDGSWSPVVRWEDPTRAATLSFQDGAVTISVPGNKAFTPHWPGLTAPSLRTIPSFSGSLAGNWVLEAKVRANMSGSRDAKNCGAVGVSFPEGRSIFAMQENGASGRLVSLNYPDNNNLSIPFPHDTSYLRLIKTGPVYSFQYSTDGRRWTPGTATFTQMEDPTSAFVGVGTWNGASEASYTFECVTLTPADGTPE